MKNIFTILLFTISLNAQELIKHFPFADTYSIVARDSETGEIGVAVQSHWFSVGTVVSWAEAGVGAIATQSFVNISFGPLGLKLLKEGKTANEALQILLSTDNAKDYRQVAIIDANGNVAAFTGKNCIPEAGHIVGKNFSVQANMMKSNEVWSMMEKAFQNTKGSLAEKMIAALEGAESVGGDIRGKQSAALLVVKGKASDKTWEDKIVDIRIDDNPEPLKELKRIYNVHLAYEHMNAGDLAVENNDMKLAMEEYSKAENMFPDNDEMKFWHGVTLANNNRLNDAIPILKSIIKKNQAWKELLYRLPKVNLINIMEAELFEIFK
jgi:uncharacterized Ntn-hydrolase superfamily protein